VSQQINLYNPQFEHKRKLFGAATMAQALLLLLVGVLALAFYGERSVKALQVAARDGAQQVDKKKRELEAVSTEFAPRQKSAELEAELAENEAQLAALKRIASAVDRGDLGNATGYSEYFKALARQHVDGLWLTGLAITGAGCEIGVRGRAVDASLLPGFLGNLTREKIMQGKSFGSLQISHPEPAATTAATTTANNAGKDNTPGKVDPAGKGGTAAAAPYVEFSLQSKPEGAQS
jgi:hypothetical protein